MNKKIFSYMGFLALFAAVLCLGHLIACAGDQVRRIKLDELNSLLESNKGKVVIVDLWATWCPPCRKEIPGFINLYNKYKTNGVEIIGIAFDENGPEVVPPFIKKTGINYPVYLGGDDIAEAHDLRAYPTTIVYGKNGKVASRHIGYVSEKDFDDEISALMRK
ncbi:MAG: redoxin domain-containing protein [Planctomycetia bacterium]|nr:redoxin domain-containing protein [Planctomycetia bacterium]